MAKFKIESRVRRIEQRISTGATVLSVENGPEEPVYLLAYDEGGTGYWPESALEAESAP